MVAEKKVSSLIKISQAGRTGHYIGEDSEGFVKSRRIRTSAGGHGQRGNKAASASNEREELEIKGMRAGWYLDSSV